MWHSRWSRRSRSCISDAWWPRGPRRPCGRARRCRRFTSAPRPPRDDAEGPVLSIEDIHTYYGDSYVLQGVSLEVLEHLSVAARADGAVGNEPWTLDRVFGLYPRLRERHAHRGSMLSGGEQQMLAIARALTTNPRLLLMDEPSEGLAPLLVRELGGSIGRLKEAGLSILLVEQNLPMALAIADEVYVLSKGRVVYRGTPAALSADAAVKHRYLGV